MELAEFDIKKLTEKQKTLYQERCLKEYLYVGLLVPESIEIGNIYEIDVPKKPWYLRKEKSGIPEVIKEIEVAAVVTEETVESFGTNTFDVELKPDEIEKAVYGDTEPQIKVVTKEIYESMTDKEKVEWIGIDGNDIYGSMKKFHKKMESIGITYKYRG
jgi:hypothetical protein